jgi:PelA/Pel-15E family pectate lyase
LGYCAASKNDRYQIAFDKGLDFLLAAQYPNGGWPQFWPLKKGYYTHITFNDDAMIGVLELLRTLAQGKSALVNPKRRAACAVAVAKGINCILKCQVIKDGKKTVWCAQHDEQTFAPAKARAYELPSLSGSETVPIVRFLMAERRTPTITEAVESAVAWLQAAKLTGIRVEKQGDDRVVVQDPKVTPLWARFYDLETNKPFFCGRDGIKRATLAEIEKERRMGYSWYTDRAQSLLDDDYPAWRKRIE